MSTTERCPNCEGFCCRADSGMTVEHRACRYARHVCPDCDAGLVWSAYTEPAPRPVRTAEEERADVLAYLAYARTFPFTYLKGATAIIDAIREHIEQGQHEGWAAKEKTP
jgi:hypothetical protein